MQWKGSMLCRKSLRIGGSCTTLPLAAYLPAARPAAPQGRGHSE